MLKIVKSNEVNVRPSTKCVIFLMCCYTVIMDNRLIVLDERIRC